MSYHLHDVVVTGDEIVIRATRMDGIHDREWAHIAVAGSDSARSMAQDLINAANAVDRTGREERARLLADKRQQMADLAMEIAALERLIAIKDKAVTP